MMSIEKILQSISFGERVAEEEAGSLKNYFVQTNEWLRLYSGEVDIVYGLKGAGKSALYALLQEKINELFDSSVFYVAAENPRGATAFRQLKADPPTSEREFQQLWKYYFLALIAGVFDEYGIINSDSKIVIEKLRELGLFNGSVPLSVRFTLAMRYVKRLFHTSAIKGSVSLDPITTMPVFSAEVTPTAVEDELEKSSIEVNELLDHANKALEREGYKVWLGIDRLDVAFEDDADFEANALRALFKVYSELRAFDNIKLKIFLRSDIWKRITEGGFREGSHITRSLTINWTPESLLNLVLKRLLQSTTLLEAYSIDVKEVIEKFNEQEKTFYRIFPGQIDIGSNKPVTWNWIISRVRDGSGSSAPRELIHYLNTAREIQLQQLSLGAERPTGENLFSRAVLKESLKPVSKIRLEQTLYAEFPRLKTFIIKLEEEKATQTLESLVGLWKISQEETIATAEKLIHVGFFERRGTKKDPIFWIPFLYRDALNLIQGMAE